MKRAGGGQPPQPSQSHDGIGARDFGTAADRARAAARRMKKGECATCGVRVQKQSGLLGKKLVPLTIPGHVLDGRCLRCYPLDEAELEQMRPRVLGGYHPPGESGIEVPQELMVNDDATVVSAITVEHFPSRRSIYRDAYQEDFGPQPGYEHHPHSSGMDSVPPPMMRPEASAGYAQNMPPPRRELYPGQPQPIPEYQTPAQQSHVPPENSHQAPHRTYNSGNQNRSSRTQWQPDTISEGQLYDGGSVQASEILFDARAGGRGGAAQDTSTHSFDLDSFDSLPVHHVHHKYSEIVEIPPVKTSSSQLQRIHETDPGVSPHNGMRAMINNGPTNRQRVNSRDISVTHSTESSSPRECRYSMNDVEKLLAQLENQNGRERTLHVLGSLTACVWGLGGPAKECFVDASGVEKLSQVLWSEMSNIPVVEATASLLLALVSQGDSSRQVHVFASGGATDGLMDALLITMQTHVNDELIQEMFCRIFCCLASQSGVDRQVNDGSLSGAVQAILKATYSHADSERIQFWGVRALYNQCVYSRNAEPNKRTLASVSLDNDLKGPYVLHRILKSFSSSDPVMEWCCRLYWVLSTSADVVEMMAPVIEAMRDMYRVLRDLSRGGSPSTLEAILGALSNFSVVEKNRCGEENTDTIFFLFDIIRSSRSSIGLVVESCNLAAAVAKGEHVKGDEVVQNEGIRFLLGVMSSFKKDADVIDSVLRFFIVLSNGSESVKSELCEPGTLAMLLETCAAQEALSCQEMCTTLLSSILVPEALGQDHPEQNHIIDYLLFATAKYPDSKRIHDSCCNVIRNLSCFQEYTSYLANDDVLKMLINSMRNFSDTGSIQQSVCCALWNLGFEGVGSEHIQCILTTLQNHLDNKDVVHMGCGALWAIVGSFEELKRELVNSESGIETIACVLVMHPSAEELLETASGLLTSLTTTSELVEGVVSTQAFHNVVDSMKSENASVNLLECGTLFVGNVCLGFPEFADEAVAVIPNVLHAMKKYNEEANFQKAACSFIWLVATKSIEAKSKILALDGVAILMAIMEQYAGLEDVEEAALGAFRELTLS